MGEQLDIIAEDLKSIGASFRINDLNEALEVKYKGKDWVLLDDTLEAVIRTELRELGYGQKGGGKANRIAVSEGWITLAHKNRYNPIKAFFEQAGPGYEPRTPTWATNPQPYQVFEIAKYFDNPDGYFGLWLFRWMVGAIARVFEQARNPMLVMSGGQEIGKSYFIRWLCPYSLRDFFREGAIRPDVKDERIRLADIFIQEVPELGNTTRKADIEGLKDYITRKHIVERPPYGSRPIKKPAITSFIGSVNFDGAGFLADSTGNSRFLTCEINRIDFKYSQLNSDLLWLEAYWFYKNIPNSWELTPDEKRARDEINSKFEMVNALEDVVLHILDITGNEGDFLPTIEIRSALSSHYKFTTEQAFNRELSKTLKALGCWPGRVAYREGGPHHRGWYGLKRHSQAKGE
jgi:predicted P-loop ATPase